MDISILTVRLVCLLRNWPTTVSPIPFKQQLNTEHEIYCIRELNKCLWLYVLTWFSSSSSSLGYFSKWFNPQASSILIGIFHRLFQYSIFQEGLGPDYLGIGTGYLKYPSPRHMQQHWQCVFDLMQLKIILCVVINWHSQTAVHIGKCPHINILT